MKIYISLRQFDWTIYFKDILPRHKNMLVSFEDFPFKM
jgi:hypothetical protein